MRLQNRTGVAAADCHGYGKITDSAMHLVSAGAQCRAPVEVHIFHCASLTGVFDCLPLAGGLSEDQIQQMVRDAESYAEKDKERKELVEARNEADTLCYSVDKSVQEYKVRGMVQPGGASAGPCDSSGVLH